MFVFPMAGLSSRFAQAGYTQPKYMLPAGDRTLFEHAISGFRTYYAQERFLFVYLAGRVDPDFILDGCARRGLPRANVELAALSAPTDGQASTVVQGLELAGAPPGERLIIFNIDSAYRRFHLPAFASHADVDGYLDVMKAPGDHWSFAAPAEEEADEGIVLAVAEKRRISELCSTGLYYFRTAELFRQAYGGRLDDGEPLLRETYIAPLYNWIIKRGGRVMYRTVDAADVAFSGTPDEYQAFLRLMPFEYE